MFTIDNDDRIYPLRPCSARSDRDRLICLITKLGEVYDERISHLIDDEGYLLQQVYGFKHYIPLPKDDPSTIGIKVVGKTVTLQCGTECAKHSYSHYDNTILVCDCFQSRVEQTMSDWMDGTTIQYDQLLHLLIMVKDGGSVFRDVLEHNLPLFDYWTILDTGSEDGSLKLARSYLTASDRGRVEELGFVDFSTNRNYLMDLAEKRPCVFTVMLDDSYFLEGDLRPFLHRMRTDTFADSYSLMVEQDVCYTTNRIAKTMKRLRYKYRIHEILEKSVNVEIPSEISRIRDVRVQEHLERTHQRKVRDIEFLEMDMKDHPDDPRLPYYMGETYLYINDYQNAFKWYSRRAEMEGFHEERYDATYKMAVLADMYLFRDWSVSLGLYLRAYELNPNRIDVLYQLAKHYYDSKQYHTALLYAEKAIGNDMSRSIAIKRDMKEIHLPHLLQQIHLKLRTG